MTDDQAQESQDHSPVNSRAHSFPYPIKAFYGDLGQIHQIPNTRQQKHL
jgi:hypothetical protein